MREFNVREMRAAIGQLDKLVDEAGEIVVSRRGRAIARILPVAGARRRPDHADLRARTPQLRGPSAELIRAERDER